MSEVRFVGIARSWTLSAWWSFWKDPREAKWQNRVCYPLESWEVPRNGFVTHFRVFISTVHVESPLRTSSTLNDHLGIGISRAHWTMNNRCNPTSPRPSTIWVLVDCEARWHGSYSDAINWDNSTFRSLPDGRWRSRIDFVRSVTSGELRWRFIS